jgi:hypothetical protein
MCWNCCYCFIVDDACATYGDFVSFLNSLIKTSFGRPLMDMPIAGRR